MSKCYQLICRDVALYYMIQEAARQLSTGESTHDRGAAIYPHTRPSTSLKRPCSVSVSVSLVWSFGTINKPRMNVFDCRRQFKGICHRCHQMCRPLFIFHSLCVTSAHEVYPYRLMAKNLHIGMGWKWRTQSNTRLPTAWTYSNQFEFWAPQLNVI